MQLNSCSIVGQRDRGSPDAIALEIFRHLFTALTEEMGAALRRASFSPNIKERRDYSCALFSARGAPIALGDHMPVHLGAMPMSVESALSELGPLDAGDVVCLNDPFRGGTHLPDITLISPVHDPDRGTPLGYVASRAHHSDVGGMSPGSMPLAQEIYQEGLRIPPVYLYREGVRQEGVWNLILANVRTPIERSGDLDAQLAALHAGASRLLEIVKRRGTKATMAAMDALVGYADRLVEAGLAYIELGKYEAEDFMDDDGFGAVDIPIRVRLVRRHDGLDVDFTGSSPQVKGGINAVTAITDSATRYTVRCVVEALLGESLPAGGGSMSMVRLILPENSVVNAGPPASVAGGERRDQPADHRCPLAGVRTRSSGPHSGTFPGHDEQHDNRRCGSQERSQFRLLRDSWGGDGCRSDPAWTFRCSHPYVELPEHANRSS